MKLLNPTIYVPHKVGEDWAKSAFQFEGLVDKRRIKRMIIQAFKNGGERVSPRYIEACIQQSLSAKQVQVPVERMPLPDDAQVVTHEAPSKVQ